MDSQDDKSEVEKNYDRAVQRLEVLLEMERLADNHFKTTNLFLAKGMETLDPIWIKKGDEMCKEYSSKRAYLEHKYVELGGRL